MWGESIYLELIFYSTMLNMKYTESCKNIFKNHKLLTLYAIYLYVCVIFGFDNLSEVENRKHKQILLFLNTDWSILKTGRTMRIFICCWYIVWYWIIFSRRIFWQISLVLSFCKCVDLYFIFIFFIYIFDCLDFIFIYSF